MENIVLIVIVAVFGLFIIAELVVLIQRSSKPVVIDHTIERVVPAISQFNDKADVTTVCPVPLASLSCSHDWEIQVEQVLDMPHEKKCIAVLSCVKCGLLDKTVQTTSLAPKPLPPPPPPPLPRSECRHKWEKEKSVVLDSAYEQMSKVRGSNGQWKKDAKEPDLDEQELEPWMFRKRYISVRVCTSCGEIDRCLTANFEEGEENDPEAEE